MAIARPAFTIIELLVAVTTFTVLAFLTVSVVGNLADLQVSRRADQQLAASALSVQSQVQDIARRTTYEPAGTGQRVWVLPISGRPGVTEQALLMLTRPTTLTDTQSTSLEWNLLCTPGLQATTAPVSKRSLMLYTLTHIPGDSPAASVTDCTPNQVINRSWTAREMTSAMYVHSFTAQIAGTSQRTGQYQVVLLDPERVSDISTMLTSTAIPRVTITGFIGGGSL